MTRKASSSLDHYFLAGRSMPWYLLGIAGMTAWFDMTGTMIITSFLYMLGPRGLFIEFRGGAVLVLALLLAYAGKWHRRSGCMTGAEWTIFRFGHCSGAGAVRVISAVLGVTVNIGMLAYLVRGTSLFLDMFFPYPPTTCALILVAITTIYTMCAGFYGVVLADLLQGIIIMITCVIVGFIAWGMVPDSSSLASVASQVTGNSQWTHSIPAWHTSMPKGYGAYQSLIMFALFYLVRNILGGMNGGAEPRYFGARNDRECGTQSLLQGITVAFRWPMMVGFAVMGIYLVKGMYPDPSAISQAADLIHKSFPAVTASSWHDLTSSIAASPARYAPSVVEGLQGIFGADWGAKLALVGYHGTVNPERILPAVLTGMIPVGLKGLILVAMFAAMMSTFTATVNMASALFVRDIYQNLMRPRAANRELIAISWLTTLVIVAVGFGLGITASSINDLWGWIIMSLTAGGTAAMLRLYWWRTTAWGMAGGALLGCMGSILQRAFIHQMVEWQQFIIMTGLSFIGTVGVSLLTRIASMETMMHFYKTTRPFGWWGPVKAQFTKEEQKKLTSEHRNDIITVPFALLWQVTMFLLPMQLVIKSYSSFWLTLPLFLVGVAGLYWFWWRNLPKAEPTQKLPERDGVPLKEAEAKVTASKT
ncbi:MAG: sodium:solute symporter [Armatimonadetes bacterium]|nr:sodium:solute symporter [Armatimonadota bacterium]